MKNISNSYDVVIIGSGIGGLISGIECARSGLKTLIVEQHDKPGGCCSYFSRKGFTFDAGAHFIAGIGNEDIFLGKHFINLGIDLNDYFIKIDPCDNLYFPDGKIQVPSELSEYIDYLVSRFPEDKSSISEFYSEIKRILLFSLTKNNPLIEQYGKMTFQEMMDSFFLNDKLKSIISTSWPYIGTRPDNLSAMSMSSLLATFHYYNIYSPRGGMKRFVSKLVQIFEEFNGQMVFSCDVKKILIKNGHTDSIIIESKTNHIKNIKSNIIISNADARHTFYDLIGEDYKKYLNDEFVLKLDSFKQSSPVNVLYLGVDIDKTHLTGKNGLYFKSYDINGTKPVFINIPTITDPSCAPDGKHIIVMIEPGAEIDSDIEYNTYKQNIYNDYIEFLEKNLQIDDLPGKIIVKVVATAKTFERYTRNYNGAPYGWESIPGQVLSDTLPNRTPVEGLFLVGHWSYPGTGIFPCIMSGLLTSKEITKEVGGK